MRYGLLHAVREEQTQLAETALRRNQHQAVELLLAASPVEHLGEPHREVVLLHLVDVVRRLEHMPSVAASRGETAPRLVRHQVPCGTARLGRRHGALLVRHQLAQILARFEETRARAIGNHDQGSLVPQLHPRACGRRAVRRGFITCLAIPCLAIP